MAGWLALSEDNARVLLLAVMLLLYMLLGALLFQWLESSAELQLVHDYGSVLQQFQAVLENTTLDQAALENLLSLHTAVNAGGGYGRRWDFAGSFHFVSTIVSTIGEISIYQFHILLAYCSLINTFFL